MSSLKNVEDRWLGVVALNAGVASTIRKYGAPAYSKPHGPGKMILYYPNPDFRSEAEAENPDYAGTVTPGNRSVVVNGPMPGALEHGSEVTSRVVVAGAGAKAGIGNQNIYANPNELTRDVQILNEEELDDEVLAAEQQALDARNSLTARDKIAGEGRPAMAGHLSATPFMAPAQVQEGSRGPASIPFLDTQQRSAIVQGLRSEDGETRELAAEAILQLIPMLPENDETGGTSLGGNEEPTPPDDLRVERGESDPPADSTPTLDSRSPAEKLKEAHPDWNYAFLSAKSKSELEDLADQAERLGIDVKRLDDKAGALRVEDYIAALRTDK